ncbi:MAG: hypothetical protein ACYTG1_04245 [Planctomycetota bacterium]|jgi:hypothetical protein
MKKVVRIVGICSRPLQARYLAATPAERKELDVVVEQESSWMVGRMQNKGYRLEGTVAGVLGIFTRGPAQGSIVLRHREPATVSS